MTPSTLSAVDSAIAHAHAILASPGLVRHKRRLLDVCIWHVSEAEGKYGVRYWSEGICDLVAQHGNLKAVRKLRPLPVRHEHVMPRKPLIDAMLADPDCVDRVLRHEVCACLVTADEHRRLDNHLSGFARYHAAGIRVWDTETEQWLSSD